QLRVAGEGLPALICDAIGAERAEAAEAAVLQELSPQMARLRLSCTLPYSPGYCGMALTEQRKLFGLFGDQSAGVSLSETCLMRPLKSISGLIGVASESLVVAHGSPCDRCELHQCAMRR
ncbi:MAG: hypothetical protein KDA61_20270, partial [Planctomycetales bacterium]|nr:hypothetical protein [Planctomycetales bacterium]